MTCPVCKRGPVERPDPAGRHVECGRHVTEDPITVACATCRRPTSALRSDDPATVVCCDCRDGVTPETQHTRPAPTASERLDAWARGAAVVMDPSIAPTHRSPIDRARPHGPAVTP